ncbi:hypothetical protein B0T20DRAFT_487843, partial [Sordaria brevicollis]
RSCVKGGDRFKWLSRSTARIIKFDSDGNYTDDSDICRAPLGEDEPVILVHCHQLPWTLPPDRAEEDHSPPNGLQNDRRWNTLLYLLQTAKDYQLMIYDVPPHEEPYMVDQSIARIWGVFADRALGEDWPEERYTKWDAQTFVEVGDVAPVVKLVRGINDGSDGNGDGDSDRDSESGRDGNGSNNSSGSGGSDGHSDTDSEDDSDGGGSRHLTDQELFPMGNALDDLQDQRKEEWARERFSSLVAMFEGMWARGAVEDAEEHEGEDGGEEERWSRYGRMPKIGRVLRFDVTLTLKVVNDRLRHVGTIW